MNPHFQARLVNDPFGDPALYVAFKFRRRGLLFDLGDLTPLSPRELLAVDAAFVSHTHIDHFCGFDTLLRLLVGREKRLNLFGPAGFLGHVEAKLCAYTWNLAPSYDAELALTVTEVESENAGRAAEFRLRDRFARRDLGPVAFADRVLVAEPDFRVRFAILDHGVPCLAFALEESRHVNVWRNEVEAMDLPVGPWLADLKAAVHREEPDETPLRIHWRDETGEHRECEHALGELRRRCLSVVPGQRIVYVTDVTPHEANFRAIVELAEGADFLFGEAAFLAEDASIAAAKGHLTADDIGTIARRAAAKRLIPFHFSPRYSERAEEVAAEAQLAFAGPQSKKVS